MIIDKDLQVLARQQPQGSLRGGGSGAGLQGKVQRAVLHFPGRKLCMPGGKGQGLGDSIGGEIRDGETCAAQFLFSRGDGNFRKLGLEGKALGWGSGVGTGGQGEQRLRGIEECLQLALGGRVDGGGPGSGEHFKPRDTRPDAGNVALIPIDPGGTQEIADGGIHQFCIQRQTTGPLPRLRGWHGLMIGQQAGGPDGPGPWQWAGDAGLFTTEDDVGGDAAGVHGDPFTLLLGQQQLLREAGLGPGPRLPLVLLQSLRGDGPEDAHGDGAVAGSRLLQGIRDLRHEQGRLVSRRILCPQVSHSGIQQEKDQADG